LATIQLCFVTVPYLQYIFSVNTAGMNKLKIIMPVLYGYETWSATFRGEQKLIVFENRVLRDMFGTERGSNRRLAKTK